MNTLSGADQVTSMSLPLMAVATLVGLPGDSTRVAVTVSVHGLCPAALTERTRYWYCTSPWLPVWVK